MRTEDAETIPHRKKKDSDKSKAAARSDHEHYYALFVKHYHDVTGQHEDFTNRRVGCIFCGEAHRMMPFKTRDKLEVFSEETIEYASKK